MLPSKAILRGKPCLVGELITATGTGFVRPFSVLGLPGAFNTVHFQALGTFTVFNGNVEVSFDGGTTYSVFTAFDFVGQRVFIIDLSPGGKYRFNIVNLTQSSPPSILATLV